MDVDENFIAYCLFPLVEVEVDQLKRYKARVLARVCEWCSGYIWQRDAFTLETSRRVKPEWGSRDCLWGRVRFGDSVEEEWFVVSILWRISEEIPELAIRIWDNDGELLFIESAYSLPKWIKPEISKYRAWIREGRVHIIGKTVSPERDLMLDEAIDVLKHDKKSSHLASEGIQKKIVQRVEEALKDRTQCRSKCLVPVRLAYLLKKAPFLISEMVSRFLERDVSDMNLISRPVLFPPEDMVMTTVEFNRCSYAQLMQHEFHLPKNFSLPENADASYKAVDIGMKVSFGAELLGHCFLHQDGAIEEEREEWNLVQSFLSSSSQSDSLAYDAYRLSRLDLSEEGKRHWMRDLVEQALQALVSKEEFLEEFGCPDGDKDDDNWLTDGQRELDKELEKRREEMGSEGEKFRYNAEDMVNSLGHFVNSTSSYEGAESSTGVTFNLRRFVNELKETLGIDEKLPLEESDGDSKSVGSSNAFSSTESDIALDEEDSDDDSDFIEAYDSALQSELEGTKLRESFTRRSARIGEKAEVDLEENLLQNFMKSIAETSGGFGPADCMLRDLDTEVLPN